MYSISVQYLQAKPPQGSKASQSLMREAQHDTGAEAKGILHIV
jgi:hypothetical protein